MPTSVMKSINVSYYESSSFGRTNQVHLVGVMVNIKKVPGDNQPVVLRDGTWYWMRLSI